MKVLSVSYSLLCVFAPILAGAAPDRPEAEVFVTFAINESSSLRSQDRVNAALNAKESRPAEQDPEGNWGDAANGFQLSLRFSKNVFNVGEPIIVDTYLRNVSDQPLRRAYLTGKGFESKLCQFLVTREGNGPAEQTQRKSSFVGFGGSGRIAELFPKAQWRAPVRLDEIFKMDTPGVYVVTGVSAVGEPAAEIRSGNAVIRIVENAQTDSRASLNPAQNATPVIVRGATEGEKDSSFTLSDRAALSQPPEKSGVPHTLAARSAIGDSGESFGVVSPASAISGLIHNRKVGAGIIAALAVLLLAILWRASRRKRV